MDRDALFARYEELRAYVGWTEADAATMFARSGDGSNPTSTPSSPTSTTRSAATPRLARCSPGETPRSERLKTTLLRWVVRPLLGPL